MKLSVSPISVSNKANKNLLIIKYFDIWPALFQLYNLATIMQSSTTITLILSRKNKPDVKSFAKSGWPAGWLGNTLYYTYSHFFKKSTVKLSTRTEHRTLKIQLQKYVATLTGYLTLRTTYTMTHSHSCGWLLRMLLKCKMVFFSSHDPFTYNLLHLADTQKTHIIPLENEVMAA